MVSKSSPNAAFWRGKRVLITGHTGFKGSWLSLWLCKLGVHVHGIALPPSTDPSLFSLAMLDEQVENNLQDIRDSEAVAGIIKNANPDIVFHLAAQPLVRASYRNPLYTFSTNVQGTANVLDAVRSSEATKVVVVITTDKVYRNCEHPFPYRETDPLGGHDPYSASKAAAELVIQSYRDSFLAEQGVAVASARAGNVVGGGDWSEDRLIPDAVRAWANGRTLHVRRPEATRPWQHVLEPLAGYITLAECLWSKPGCAGAYNFGPLTHEASSVREVICKAQACFGEGEITFGDGNEGPHEAGWLALEIAKARSELGVARKWMLDETIERTMNWYRMHQQGISAFKLCNQDIDAFTTSEDHA